MNQTAYSSDGKVSQVSHDSNESPVRAREGTTIHAHNSRRPGGNSAIGIPVSGGEWQGKAGEDIDYHLHTRPRERAGPDQGLTNPSAAELTAAAEGQCCHAKVC